MSRPEPEKFDVVVIGAGPAGERGAAQAAFFGKRVALVEGQAKPGGACANTGTLPSKNFRETALHLSGLAARGITGVNIDLSRALTATKLVEKNALVMQSEHERIYKNIEKHGIEHIEGHAEFEDTRTVLVKGAEGAAIRVLTAEHFLIAAGTSPHRPKEVPFDDKRVCDSDSILWIREIPRSIAIVGAGVIGAEYASIFAALGAQVHLIDAKEQMLPFLDHEIATVMMREMERLGVHFHLGSPVAKYIVRRKFIVTELESDKGETIETESLLYAQGRTGNTKNLGLEKIGLTPDKRGLLKVNEHYQTDVSHIYAAGDVIGFPALASTSMDQGRLAMSHACEKNYRERLPGHLPIGIYTIPEVSSVGETEETAREKKLDFEIGRAYFCDNARAEIMGDTGGMLKIIFDAKTQRVLGVHIVCERASEIVTPGLFAVRLGVPLEFFIDTVFNFPTLSDAYKYAAYDGLGRLADRTSAL